MSIDHDPTEINALAILGADPDVRELASLERLRLAAKVAQAERNMSEKTRARRWKKGSGAVITHGELMGELNKAQKIEIDVAPLPVKEQARVMARQGMSLTAIIKALGLQGIDAPSETTLRRMVRDILSGRNTTPCKRCGALVHTSPAARGKPKVCDACKHPACPCGCGVRASRTAMTPSAVTKRNGALWGCKSFVNRQRHAALTREQRSERTQRANALTREQRSAVIRRANASRTPQQKYESGRKGHATRKARRAGQTEPPR